MCASRTTASAALYREIAKGELEAFLQATAAKGLQFIKLSAHWSESLLWILLLLAGTLLAIYDVRKTCNEFASEQTHTQMFLLNNRRLWLERATICIDFDPRFINLTHYGLQRHANASTIFDLVGADFNASAPELLYRTLKLLTIYSLLENGRRTDIERKVNVLLASDDALLHLHDSLRARSVSVLQLSRTVGVWLCLAARVQIEIHYRGKLLRTIDPCRPTKISWLGGIPFLSSAESLVTVCVNVSGDIAFESIADTIVLRVDTEGLFMSSADHDYDTFTYLDLSGDPVSSDMTKDWSMFPQRGCTAIDLGIDAELHLLDRSTARCDNEAGSLLACYGQCALLKYAADDVCNCSFSGWLYMREEGGRSPSKPTCFDRRTIQEMTHCRFSTPSTSAVDPCHQACLYPCTLRQYSLHPSSLDCWSPNNSEYRGLSIELSPKRFTVPVFDERLNVGVSELFSRIGGTCGLWLGVGMLGICHALLFPVKVLLKCLRQACRGNHDHVENIALALVPAPVA